MLIHLFLRTNLTFIDSPETLQRSKSPDKLNLKLSSDQKTKAKKVEEKNLNRDSATFRFRDGATKIVGDYELSEIFKLKAIDPFWSKLYSIQTIVKSKVGLGLFTYVEFIAPMTQNYKTEDIEYDFKSFGSDIDLDNGQY